MLGSAAFEDGGEFGDFLAHHLSGLELDGGALGDDEAAAGLVGVAAHAGFGEADFEDAEVTQFDGVALGEGVGDMVEGALDDIEYLMLNQIGFAADAHDEFAFRKGGHIAHLVKRNYP